MTYEHTNPSKLSQRSNQEEFYALALWATSLAPHYAFYWAFATDLQKKFFFLVVFESLI